MATPSTPDDEQPDATVLWRWVWSSVRPVLGYVFVAIGLMLLLAAYLGVSREVLVARQLPYLASGGLFGLAAVTLGSRLILIEDLRRDAGRLDKLERAVTELHSALLSRPDAPAGEPPQDTARSVAVNGHDSASSSPERLLALVGGESFHRQDCPVVVGKERVEALTAGAAKKKGLHACRMCQPLVSGV